MMSPLKAFRAWRKQAFQNWLARRIPAVAKHKLGYRQIFIFPTKVGFAFAGLVLIVLIGATNYQNNLAFALVFWLVSLGFLAIAYTFRNLLDIEIKALPIKPIFAGEPCFAEFLLQSQHPHKAIGLGRERQIDTMVVNVGHKAKTSQIELHDLQRGFHRLPSIYIETQYPLGIIHAWSWLRFNQEFWVYPKPIEPQKSQFKEGGTDDDAEQEAVQGRGDDFHGLKQYQAGDSPKRIDWKAYARERGLHTKDMRAPQSEALWFRWDDFPGATPELRLSYITFLVRNAALEEAEFGIKIPGFKSAVGSDETHIRHCLEALAVWGQESPLQQDISSKQPSKIEKSEATT